MDPFSKGFPSGSTVGCSPFPSAVKDHLSHFHMGGQVSLLVALLGYEARSKCCFIAFMFPKKLPHEKTSNESLVWNSTPSPWRNNGIVFCFQCFSNHMGWPASLSSPVATAPFQKSASSKTKCFMEEVWIVLPQMGEHKVYGSLALLFQRGLWTHTHTPNLQGEWRWKLHIRAKFPHNLNMSIATVSPPGTCLSQLDQFGVRGTILKGQVSQLPHKDSWQEATGPQVQQLSGQAWMWGRGWFFIFNNFLPPSFHFHLPTSEPLGHLDFSKSNWLFQIQLTFPNPRWLFQIT